MTRLKACRVIGKTYRISFVQGKPLDDGDLGELDPAKQGISIRKGQPLEQEQDTVLHEIFHAVDTEGNLGLSERQVRGLGTIFLGVLKDNPSLIRYLTKRK